MRRLAIAAAAALLLPLAACESPAQEGEEQEQPADEGGEEEGEGEE